MTAMYYAFGAGVGVGFVIALGAIAIMAAISTMGEDDIEPPSTRRPDDRHQWRNNSAKAHHAE